MGEAALGLIQLLGDRLWIAATTLPSLMDWTWNLGGLAVYGAIAIPMGFWQGLLTWEPLRNWRTILTTTVIALFFPAVFEEILFRVFWLPQGSEPATITGLWVWGGMSLGVFIVSHPLNALIFFPSRRATFYDPVFLSLAGVLGGVCTVSYLQSHSLWPPVFLHWGIVVIWLVLLGGENRLAGPPQPDEQEQLQR